MSVTEIAAQFSAETTYDLLPSPVVHETKRLILDTIGCALGGARTEKGVLALRLSRTLGGADEASLLGTGERLSVTSSAFATGELINALDYDALLSPPDHATPYVFAAPLAIGEFKKVSGKAFIVATAIAHELSTRFAASLNFGRRFHVKIPEKNVSMSIPTPGYGLCALSGVAAAGRLMGFDTDKIAHAMGIMGYLAPVPMLMKFATTPPAPLTKYLSAGPLSLNQALTVIWVDMGCTGDVKVLDGEYGFWRAMGCEGWTPDVITKDLGSSWLFPGRLFFKKFPCCGAMQNALAHFMDLVADYGISPDDIQRVIVKLNPLAELPLWRHTGIETHIDAQFNIPFGFAALAHGIDIGPSWQTEETLCDGKIRGFMEKVDVLTELNGQAGSRPDLEILVGQGAKKKTLYGEGPAQGLDMNDGALLEKFKRNAAPILKEKQMEKALGFLNNLENCPQITDLLESICPEE